jgi:hypothetical protein
MDNSQIVEILYGLCDLAHDPSRLLLCEFAFLELLEERAAIHVFENYIQMRPVFVEAVHGEDVFVA